MTEHQQDAVVATQSTNLGDQLKQAREHKKYSVAEVAAQLRLTKDIVGYLENQQWEKLNGRIYARGYFASYVKFLGLPHDEMLAVFNLEYSATEPSLSLTQREHRIDEKSFPWMLLLFVVIVLGGGWLAYQQWQNKQLAEDSEAIQETEQVDSIENRVVEPLESNEMATSQPDVLPEAISPESDYDASDNLALEQEDLGEVSAAEAMNAETVSVETIVTPSEDAVSEPEMLATASTLKLSFSGECWVEVTNADAKVLVSKVMRAQDSLELSTEQPLKLLLGRAEVATVIFNNQQVDLSPYTQGNVARLTLGVES